MNDIIAILKLIRPEADFASAQNYLDEGLLDSFDLVMLVSELDKRYGISIAGADIVPENFGNVAAIRSLLQKYGVAS